MPCEFQSTQLEVDQSLRSEWKAKDYEGSQDRQCAVKDSPIPSSESPWCGFS